MGAAKKCCKFKKGVEKSEMETSLDWEINEDKYLGFSFERQPWNPGFNEVSMMSKRPLKKIKSLKRHYPIQSSASTHQAPSSTTPCPSSSSSRIVCPWLLMALSSLCNFLTNSIPQL